MSPRSNAPPTASADGPSPPWPSAVRIELPQGGELHAEVVRGLDALGPRGEPYSVFMPGACRGSALVDVVVVGAHVGLAFVAEALRGLAQHADQRNLQRARHVLREHHHDLGEAAERAVLLHLELVIGVDEREPSMFW
jgi:hypothetical protein